MTNRKCKVYDIFNDRWTEHHSREEAEAYCMKLADGGNTSELYELYTTWTPERLKKAKEVKHEAD